MKRIISVLVAMSMMSMLAAGLTACGESESEGSNVTDSETSFVSKNNEDTKKSEDDTTVTTDEVAENETNPEIESLKAALLEKEASYPEPDGRHIKKASKYRVDGSLVSETEYYENGVVADIIEYNTDGYKKTETKYNESGEITEDYNYSKDIYIVYEYSEDQFVKRTFDSFGIDPSEVPTIEIVDQETGEPYKLCMSEEKTYTYNDNGDLLRLVILGAQHGFEASVDTWYEFVLDENDNLTEFYQIVADTFTGEETPEWEFTYDENNNMTIANIHRIPDNSGDWEDWNNWEGVRSYYTYSYDESNNLVTKKNYSRTGSGDITLNDWEEYVYDDNNLLIQRNLYDSTDALTSSNKYTYSFDGDNRERSFSEDSTILREHEYWDNGDLLLVYNAKNPCPNGNFLDEYDENFEQGYTVYWDNGNVAIEGIEKDAPIKEYDYFGNITLDSSSWDGPYTYEYTYDDSGNILTESVFEKDSRTDYTYENEYYD